MSDADDAVDRARERARALLERLRAMVPDFAARVGARVAPVSDANECRAIIDEEVAGLIEALGLNAAPARLDSAVAEALDALERLNGEDR